MASPANKLLNRSFVGLNIAQVLGAMNDNIFKLFVVFALIKLGAAADSSKVLALAGGLFAVPFILFSAAAGTLADRISKRKIVLFCKGLEVLAMILAVPAFLRGSQEALYAILFLVGTHSAIFAPAKYGIIPELVGPDRISQANGLLVMLTYLAIILGSAAAPWLGLHFGGHYAAAQWICVGLAVAGLLSGLLIRRTPPAGSQRPASIFFIREIVQTMRSVRGQRELTLAVYASAYFMLLGAFLFADLIPYGMQRLGLTEERAGYLFFVAALGIAIGAFCSGRLSGRNIEFGIVPIGAMLLTVTVALLGLLHPTLNGTYLLVFGTGVGAGMFIVPIDSFIQFAAPPQQRGAVLAASGFLGWLGVIGASLLVLLCNFLKLDAGSMLIVLGALTLALTIWAFVALPDFLVRFVVLVLTRTLYRIRVLGAEKVPLDGPALLVCNHVSYMDAVLLVATQQRRLRFIMARDMFEKLRLLRPIFKLGGVIPVSMNDSPKELVRSLRDARAALDNGYMVVIFAEGGLTRTGNLRAFRRGFEHILKGSTYPIVPVHIGGAWGSLGTFYHGQLVRRWGLLGRYPVTVQFGDHLPSTAAAPEVRQAVLELSCAYFADRKARRRPLGAEFIRTARRNWSEPAISSSSGQKLTFGATLTGALALAKKLRLLTAGEDRIGLLLPASAGGALANIAVTLLGKTSVNLNFTASREAFASAIRQCGLKHILTARAFLEKFPNLPLPAEGVVCMEDLLGSLTTAEKLRALLKARLWPRRWLGRFPGGFDADRVATIIFSSGSTGEPKGVMLSHHNILSNIESLRAVFSSAPSDNLCAALPFFHSLGYTGTLWFPLLCGFSVVYHPNPLDGGVIAQLVRENHSTMLFATPGFLMVYLRKAAKEDFASLKYVVCGAEKLNPRLAIAFEEKFGVRPLEGYGATELAPVATLSLPHVEAGGVFQAGWKESSVGLPLPGVAIRIVDPDSGAPIPAGQPGLLLIKGPNVMLGYLGKPDLTTEVIQDGWYRTGDIAKIDDEGFVSITDRLSRFSKIGGEMVPHGAIEEELQRGLGMATQVLAIAAVPDEKRGEKLIVLHTSEAGGEEKIRAVLAASTLPNLWKPGEFVAIEKLPLLGTGKLDLRALKQLAAAATQKAAP
jgi:acyl-[acyl-carrier-protein]-phospholipid O-acyltransferase/long-chain-fatty-acid--[acyl-carrier-protein] ligase